MLSASAVLHTHRHASGQGAKLLKEPPPPRMVCHYFLAYSTRNVCAFSDTRSQPEARTAVSSGREHRFGSHDEDPSYLGRHGQPPGFVITKRHADSTPRCLNPRHCTG